ncbi:MAG TPA: hypothetical protein K8W25_06470 [Aerococcus urinaeequi]|nr:hypothetical protein [Aerococcus urinaeequi]
MTVNVSQTILVKDFPFRTPKHHLTTSTYTLLSGGENDGEESNGLYEGGSVTNGTELADLSVMDTITNLTSSGEIASATGMMGGGQPGQPAQ